MIGNKPQRTDEQDFAALRPAALFEGSEVVRDQVRGENYSRQAEELQASAGARRVRHISGKIRIVIR